MGQLADLTNAEIARIEQAKADIQAAFAAKGVSGFAKKTIDKFAGVIEGLAMGTPCSVTITNTQYTTGNPQGTIMFFYTKKDYSPAVMQLVAGATATIETLVGSIIVAMPYGTVAILHEQYSNGYRFVVKEETGTATLISSEAMSTFYIPSKMEGCTYSIAWAK